MEQAQATQVIPANQMATEQHDSLLNEQIETLSLFSNIESEENEEAKLEENPFWLSWYSAIMWLSLGFFLYYFPRLVGFPDDAYHVTDFIATMIDIIGFLLALMLLFMTFPKIMGNIITLSIFSLLCSMPIIMVMRLAIRHGIYAGPIAVFLVSFQILALLNGLLVIYSVFYTLYQTKPTKETIRAFLQVVTVKNVFTFLLAMLGAITAIIPFIQLVLSLITNKH